MNVQHDAGDIHKNQNVQLKIDRLIIRSLEIKDEEVVKYFQGQKQDSLDEKVRSAIRMGVIALNGSHISDRTDYVDKEFSSMKNNFTNSLDRWHAEIEKQYEQLFGEKGKFHEILKNHFGEDGLLIKLLFDPNREGTPLHKLKLEVFEN